MEHRFFDAISDEQQDKSSESIRKLKRDAEERSRSRNGNTREDIKNSYARGLAQRLKAKA